MYSVVPLPKLLDQSLRQHMERTEAFFKKLSNPPEAVILGGGYGRDEGGVFYDENAQPHFYNDLDYFIFCDNPSDPELLKAVKHWEKEESDLLGIDVEGTCIVREKLRETSTSMMFYDLVSAHKVVLGKPDYLDEYRSLADPKTIAPYESTRLLWNRGSGLFFAHYDLLTDGNLDVVHRNQSKAKLALGDSVLSLKGLYRPYVRERNELLVSLDDISHKVKSLHTEGTEFKLKPTVTPGKDTLLKTQIELSELWLDCFLRTESVRLNHTFDTALSYSNYRRRIYPNTSVYFNLILVMRDKIRRGGNLNPVWDYPRGSLQRALVALLSGSEQFGDASRYLGCVSRDISSLYESYRRWWHFYS